IWGGFHGFSILIHRVWKNKGFKMPKLMGWSITMFLINIFWIFFRATNLEIAIKIIKSMFDFRSLKNLITLSFRETANPYLGNKSSLILLIVSIGMALILKNSHEKQNNIKFNIKNNVEITIFFVAAVLLLKRVTSFLYFNF
ncbi:MAG: MBOAT family protein, partial [Cetobacterium sp.]